MAWKKDSGAAFSGASGQMAVIAELLQRKCNAAIPHVDVGMDVFAFRDDREEIARIQVKTDTGKKYKKKEGFTARFGIPTKQLDQADIPPLYYALAIRLDGAWAGFVIIRRAVLKDLYNQGLGAINEEAGNLEFRIQFRSATGSAAGAGRGVGLIATTGTDPSKRFDLTPYLNAWETLPPLKPFAPIDSTEVAVAIAVPERHVAEPETGSRVN